MLHALWTPLGITVMFAGAVGDNYLRNALEKRRVTSTFKRYVAPEIVDEILKQGAGRLELGGRLCEIAVLFVDIRGFTSMSEVLTPASGGGGAQPLPVADSLLHHGKRRHAGQIYRRRRYGLLGRSPAG